MAKKTKPIERKYTKIVRDVKVDVVEILPHWTKNKVIIEVASCENKDSWYFDKIGQKYECLERSDKKEYKTINHIQPNAYGIIDSKNGKRCSQKE